MVIQLNTPNAPGLARLLTKVYCAACYNELYCQLPTHVALKYRLMLLVLHGTTTQDRSNTVTLSAPVVEK